FASFPALTFGVLITVALGDSLSDAFTSLSTPAFGSLLTSSGQLTHDFYSRSCPRVFEAVGSEVRSVVSREKRTGASLLRLHFHDCFVNGTKVNGVLYVPDFKCNLLSVSRLSRDLQCCISFFPDFFVMQGLQRKNLIGAGRCEGGLYRMKMVQGRRAMETTVETWHKRLGHASKGKLVQFEKQIKRIRCDNGGEFTSNNMLNFYNEEGVLLETTCPHTPQQNRVVDRKHRHLLETARALMFDANLPKQFWEECILTATIIYDLPSFRMEEVAGRGGRRKKVAGRGGRRKKVTGKGGRHEEGVWSVEPDLFRSGGRRWKKVEEESPEKVCWEDESSVETGGW
ncbi:putative RNA-directed DNA polymerase, partial [Tanacetum coccineum]